MSSEIDLAIESILAKDNGDPLSDTSAHDDFSCPPLIDTSSILDKKSQRFFRSAPRVKFEPDSFLPSLDDGHSPPVLAHDENGSVELNLGPDPCTSKPGLNVVIDSSLSLTNLPSAVMEFNFEPPPCASSYIQVRSGEPSPSSLSLSTSDSSLLVDFVDANFIEQAILEIVFDSHRSAKTGLAFLRVKAARSADVFKLCISSCTDVFGTPLAGVSWRASGGSSASLASASSTAAAGLSGALASAEYCVCPECRQTTAACRFAPHLEKCMGMGRNSSRLARRRMAATCASSSSLTSLAGKNQRDTSNSTNNRLTPPAKLRSSMKMDQSLSSSASKQLTSGRAARLKLWIGGGDDDDASTMTSSVMDEDVEEGCSGSGNSNDASSGGGGDREWTLGGGNGRRRQQAAENSSARAAAQQQGGRRCNVKNAARRKLKNSIVTTGVALKKKQSSAPVLHQLSPSDDDVAAEEDDLMSEAADDGVVLSRLQAAAYGAASGRSAKRSARAVDDGSEFLDLSSEHFDVPSPNL